MSVMFKRSKFVLIVLMLIIIILIPFNFGFSQKGQKRSLVNYIIEGNQLAEQGALQRAYDKYTEAISYDPNYSLAYLNRGQVLFQMWRYQEAIQDFDKVIEFSAGMEPAPYLEKGQCYAYLGDFKSAIEQWDITISLDPSSNNPAYLYRGCIYHIMGDDRYKEDYQIMLQFMPSDAYFYDYIASILAMNQRPDVYDPDGAIEYSTTANEQTGYMDTQILYTLAESYFQKSRNRETGEYDVYYINRAIKIMERIFNLQGWLEIERNGYFIYRFYKMTEVRNSIKK